MKRVISTCLTLCLSAALALPASALDYSIDAPGNPDYGDPTSIEVVHTADGGAMKNEDISKNAALIPPSFAAPAQMPLEQVPILPPTWPLAAWRLVLSPAAICPSYSRLRLAKTQAIPALAVLADPVPLAVIPM